MWEYEHSIEATAAAESVWQLWADVENWGDWNADLERVEFDGPFATGAQIVMTPIGDDPVRLRVAELVEGELFVDQAEFGDLVLRTTHRLQRLDQERVRVTYRMEITGAGCDEVGPEIGPGITADWPETMARLIDRATAK